MVTFYPRQLASRSVAAYFISLALVTLAFMSHSMGFVYMLIGAIAVTMFFFGSASLTKKWAAKPAHDFKLALFWTALGLRLAWVTFSYYFYLSRTGVPFEFDGADSMGYMGEAEILAENDLSFGFNYLFGPGRVGVSDSGYPMYLMFLYKLIGPNIYLTRVVKALLGALSCVLIYKLSVRTFDEPTGRMAAIFCALMPNLIYWCGIHTKEIEMVTLAVAFVERADYLIRARHYTVFNIAIVALLGLSLFFFRTVLGVVAVFSFFAALLFSSDRVVGKAKRTMLIGLGVFGVTILAGGTIMMEVEGYWERRVFNEDAKRTSQSKTSKWAKYATGTVMAPMIVALPFSTMVDTGQTNQNVVHGGNFVKNTLAVFVILALFYAFKEKKWRNYTLIGVFVVGYLGIIAFSGYANAERFHMPTLPLLLVMAAKGVSQLNAKNLKYVNMWFVAVVLIEVAWAFFKLGGRGLV